MSAYLDLKNVKIESLGTKGYVPDDDLARLMYYLYCVSVVIKYDKDDKDSKLTDFKKYYCLTEGEKIAVYALIISFNPRILVEKGIFVLDSSLLPPGFSNDFIEITDERIGIHVNQEVIIGGRIVKVLKFMVCDSSWITRNYIEPVERISQTLKYRSYNNNYNFDSYSTNNKKSCCTWQKCICWFCVIFILYVFIRSLVQ